MSGTKTGGAKAAAKNKALHGEDFYARIGRIGGKNGHTGGFAAYTTCRCDRYEDEHYVSMCAGSKGGKKSRRK